MEDESQEHILVCKELLKMQKNENEIPLYDRIFYGKVKEQIEITRQWNSLKKSEEVKVEEKMLSKDLNTQLGPCDQSYFVSAVLLMWKYIINPS